MVLRQQLPAAQHKTRPEPPNGHILAIQPPYPIFLSFLPKTLNALFFRPKTHFNRARIDYSALFGLSHRNFA